MLSPMRTSPSKIAPVAASNAQMGWYTWIKKVARPATNMPTVTICIHPPFRSSIGSRDIAVDLRRLSWLIDTCRPRLDGDGHQVVARERPVDDDLRAAG